MARPNQSQRRRRETPVHQIPCNGCSASVMSVVEPAETGSGFPPTAAVPGINTRVNQTILTALPYLLGLCTLHVIWWALRRHFLACCCPSHSAGRSTAAAEADALGRSSPLAAGRTPIPEESLGPSPNPAACGRNAKAVARRTEMQGPLLRREAIALGVSTSMVFNRAFYRAGVEVQGRREVQ